MDLTGSIKESSKFDFASERTYVYKLDSNTVLKLERASHSVAMLYFKDADNNLIVIPSEIKVYTFDVNKKIVHDSIEKYSYALAYTDGYEIYYKDVMIMKIEPQRIWKITP